MANTKIPVELSSTPGIVDNSNATAITIDSSEKVTIANDLESTWAASADRFIGMKFSTTYALGMNLLESGREVRINAKAADTGGKITFGTGTSYNERMIIDGSGNVGIGTSSPNANLEVIGSYKQKALDSNSQGFTINVDSSTNAVDLTNYYNAVMTFGTANTERMRIDGSGNVGIGTSSTSNDAKLIVVGSDGKHPTIKTSDGGANGFTMLADNYTATESQVNFGVGYSTSDLVLSRCVKPSDTAEKVYLSSQAQAACKPSALVMDGDGGFRFLNTNTSATTAVDTAVSLSERMRIDASGNLLVGATSQTFGEKLKVTTSGSGNNAAFFEFTSSDDRAVIISKHGWSTGATSRKHLSILNDSNTEVGSIAATGTATTFNTSSDGRLKDVTGEARGLEVINELNPVAYNWKESGQADEGLIAQEVLNIVPNAVTGSEEKYYQMDYSKLVVHLVKGMKEQQEQIEALQSEINLLKGE